MDWQEYFLKLANLVASKSKDRSTKVGAVIVGPDNEIVSTGYNGFPRGVDDNVDSRHDRPEKYEWTEHAERNAIYNAARIGVSLKDTIIIQTMYPCIDCARGIIQSGIKEVVAPLPDFNHPQWGRSFMVSTNMLAEAGVKVTVY